MVDWLSLHGSMEYEPECSEYSRFSFRLIKIIFSGRQLTPVESHCVRWPHFQESWTRSSPHRAFSVQNKAETMKKFVIQNF